MTDQKDQILLLKAFNNIVTNNYTSTNKNTFVSKNLSGKIYKNPKFFPGGDKYMLIEFSNNI